MYLSRWPPTSSSAPDAASRFSVPYEIGLWSCPICRAANESAATLADKVVTAPTARLRRKPVPMQLAELLGRLTRKRSLYGYADQLIDVACPKCQTGITMTNNVRTARCVELPGRRPANLGAPRSRESTRRNSAKVLPLGRVAQRESTRFTREGSLVRSQPRPLRKARETGPFLSSEQDAVHGDAAGRLQLAAGVAGLTIKGSARSTGTKAGSLVQYVGAGHRVLAQKPARGTPIRFATAPARPESETEVARR